MKVVKVMRFSSGWVSLFVVLPLMAATARAQVVSLSELEASALAGHPEQGVGSARVLAAGAQIDRAEAGYLPQVTLGASASLEPGRELLTFQRGGKDFLVAGSPALGDSGAFTPQPRYGVTLGVRGSLYDFGRTSSAVTAANAQKTAADADAGARADQLVREVRAGYVRWAGAYALWQLAQENVVLVEAREKRISALIEEGARPSVDRATAVQQTSSARIEAERAAEELDAARIDLGFAAARELSASALPDTAVLDSTPPPSAATPSAAVDTRELALERAQAAAEARARMHERARAPVLGYDADTGLSGASSNLFPVYSVGVRLSVPLFDGGGASANAAEARAQAAELAAQARASRLRSEQAAARARNAQAHAARRLSLAQESLSAAEAQVGELQSAGSLDAEAVLALSNAQTARFRAKTEVVLAQIASAYARLGVGP